MLLNHQSGRMQRKLLLTLLLQVSYIAIMNFSQWYGNHWLLPPFQPLMWYRATMLHILPSKNLLVQKTSPKFLQESMELAKEWWSYGKSLSTLEKPPRNNLWPWHPPMRPKCSTCSQTRVVLRLALKLTWWFGILMARRQFLLETTIWKRISTFSTAWKLMAFQTLSSFQVCTQIHSNLLT